MNATLDHYWTRPIADVQNLFIIDLFAGGGGASEAIRRALGRCPNVAINHSPDAVEMHTANHPSTKHLCESVWDVEPKSVCGARSPDLLWASPDCTHFSRARGGKPKDKKIRGLAWRVLRWAGDVLPTVIAMENVPEFTTWGPLTRTGRIIKGRAGETFGVFVGHLQALGYAVEWRNLVACDYGAPTSRKRMFLVARRDGEAITWPEPSHGPNRSRPYRTAAECIDWSDPCPSIFDRKRPLAEATERRIAEGIRRYVLNDPTPFLLNISHGGRLEPLDRPLNTITSTPKGGDRALIVPMVAKAHSHGWDRNGGPISPADKPLWTVVAKDASMLVAPQLIHIGNGERAGQAPRCMDIREPLGTVVASGTKHYAVAAFLAKHYGASIGTSVQDPIGTVTAGGGGHHSLVAAHVTKLYGTSTGADAREPAPTITGGGWHLGAVAVFLDKYFATGTPADIREPLDTITSKHRFGLVTVELGGEPWAIVDIGMRMLQPRELATAQGFRPDYILTGTKSNQVSRIGNSVSPPPAEALIRSNLGPRLAMAAK